jgi:hypothetical protein
MQALVTSAFVTALCLCAQAQDPPAKEVHGVPPRANPAEYQAQGKAGAATIAAEFVGHAVPTPQGTFSSEGYVVVEVGIFGEPNASLKLSLEDFSLRVNGKKAPLPSQAYGLVLKSLKDPEWEPPASASSKGGKTSIGSGGGGGDLNAPPVPVHMPFDLTRAMQQKVQKAAMPEGDRPLPVAGLIFFQYSGKTKGMNSLELIYAGPAGAATLALQP